MRRRAYVATCIGIVIGCSVGLAVGGPLLWQFGYVASPVFVAIPPIAQVTAVRVVFRDTQLHIAWVIGAIIAGWGGFVAIVLDPSGDIREWYVPAFALQTLITAEVLCLGWRSKHK